MKGWVAIAGLAVASAAAAQGDQSAGVQGNPAQFFGPDAYPPEAMRAHEQGRVVARLTIDTTGRVSACAVDVSSGSAALDNATCRIATERVTFTPARDRAGRAIASTYTLPVRWVLPTNDADVVGPPVEITETTTVASAVELDITVGGGGLVERCVVTEATPPPSVDPCAQYPVGRQLDGGHTRNGKPVRTHMIFRLTSRMTVEP